MNRSITRLPSALLILFLVVPVDAQTADFVRGDVNADSSIDIRDPLATLFHLFLGLPTSLPCDDATDSDDNGLVEMQDAIFTLQYLFTAAPAPPPPGLCGLDLTVDALTCTEFTACANSSFAQVSQTTVTGAPGSYTFAVTIESPDTGCDQYADWWEVVTPEGALLYRRVLLHSHVGEQPFTRSGGPVSISEDTEVIVRAHMNTVGYGDQGLRGGPNESFVETSLSTNFAEELAELEPLPTDCAF